MKLRVATYNVHKCRGFDRRVKPERVASVIESLDADVIVLQEMLDVRDGRPEYDQARTIGRRLKGYDWRFGENRLLAGGSYGNMTLSRFAIESAKNYDLSHRQRERRGCLRTDLQLSHGAKLHVLNVHLGTGFMERRHQAKRFLGVLGRQEFSEPRLVAGDFNEWTRGLTSRRMTESFETFEPRKALSRRKTYPGLLPFLHLDHFYFDSQLKLEQLKLVRTREALIASDHLPLVAEFVWNESLSSSTAK